MKKKDKIDGYVDEECPECAKQQKHVKLVETNGKLECKSCRYYRQLLR
ncbi:MAG: hypothetical protein OEV21_05345 [Thermoplasmata archaeon]|nr:hypothetical protein [Thermoplasmata archaeon]